MSIAKSILDAVQVSREASASMIEFYYNEGVISRKDLDDYVKRVIEINDFLEYSLQSIFGVCESRLQVKKGKQ